MKHNYCDLYLKYKNKNDMYGGEIGNIDVERLKETKTNLQIPEKLKKYVEFITIPNTKIIRVGSSVAKIQPYFSDVDVMNIVDIPYDTDHVINLFVNHLKNIINKLLEDKEMFFSDFKAGEYHWKINEILSEKNEQNISLQNACKTKGVIKLDIIAPYNERYVEMSTFFVLKSNTGYINIDDDYFTNFKKSLLVDIDQYKLTKPFKAVKRVWSLSQLNNDSDTMTKLYRLVKSNVALLSQINADVETLILLLEHNSNYNNDFIVNELNGFKEKISHILDIKYDETKADILINNIIILFKNNDKKNKEELLESLKLLHDFLLEIINRETLEYLNSINYTFPTKADIEQCDIICNIKKSISLIYSYFTK